MSDLGQNESDEELLLRVEEASRDTDSAHRIRRQLGVTPEEADTPVAAVELAFSYREKIDESGDRYFASIEYDDSDIYPPNPRDVGPEVCGVWAAVAARASSPTVRARLHDLCFVARHGNGREHARAAVEAYLEQVEAYPSDSGDGPDRTHTAVSATKALTRSLELARRTGQDDLANEALTRGIGKARESLEDPDAGPGIFLRFIRPLATDVDSPPEVDELLTAARDRYRNDVWNTISVIQIQLARPGLDAEGRQALHRETVEALVQAAETSQPMIAMTHLQEAAGVAQRHHLGDLYDEVATKLQDLAGSDLGMQRFEVPVELDETQIEAWFDHITGQETWLEAFIELLRSGPPTGQVEANREFAAEMPNIAPLSTLFPTMRIGPDGLPRSTTSGGDPEHLLSEIELHRLQITGRLWSEAFRRIGEKWAPIDLDDLSAFLGQGIHVPDDVARALARAVGHHFDGDHEGAAFTALPKVERIAREILLLVGVAVFRPPGAAAPGTYVGLGTLLELLEEQNLDPSWCRFMLTFLASQSGVNLRNEALHGSVVELGEGHSALILLAAIYLAVAVRAERRSDGA